MEKSEDGKDGTSANIGRNFLKNVGLFYMFMLGENPYEGSLLPTSWLIYVIFTMLV